MRGLLQLLGLMLLAMLAVPAGAQLPGADAGPHIAIELVPETDRPAPGSTVTLAFVSRPEAGWHGYWKNPGDAGVETKLDWTLPEGVRASPLEYPVPHRLLIVGLMNYVYEGPFTQFVRLTIPAGLKPGTAVPVAVKIDYLVCTNEICVPESARLSTQLTVGDGMISSERRAQFDGWRRAMPRRVSAPASFARSDGAFRIGIPWPGAETAKDVYFFPLTQGAIDYAAPQTVTRDGEMLIIETKAATGDAPAKVDGVLAIDGRGFDVSATPGQVASGASKGAALDWGAAALAFGGALLGGLLLNIMPCVFPILSLKALSLARSGASPSHARKEALAYTAGVVLVVVALGGALLALRAAGASAGWAFQLQDPRVILVLLLLVTGIALNLAGLFELSAPGFVNRAAASGSGGAFFTGALAAFVATPCTGPFMGAALGAALVLPLAAALAIFFGLGLGLALPFLLLGFVPALRRLLPKPGAWMDVFRRILSIPMFLTALALAWVLGRQAGVDGMTLGLAAVLLASFGLWWTGRRQARGLSRQWLPALPLLAAAFATSALIHPAQGKAEAVSAIGAEPFSEERLAALRAEGRPVFAYFTADWCVTCKVNEKTAIETAQVSNAFGKRKVAVLVGDWTDGDPALGRFIEQHNRAGVPLYLWYAPGSSEPKVLPQLLTQGMLAQLPEG